MADEKTNEIEKLPIVTNNRGLALRSIEDMYRFAKAVVASGLAPKGFDKPEKVLVAMQFGAELQLTPMQSLRSVCVVNGQAGLWGDMPLGLVMQSGKMEYIKESLEGEGDDRVAVCVTKRKDMAEAKETRFSVEDAKQAGLWKKPGTWQSYPERMLKYRARSFNLRDNFPDVLCGVSIKEEYEGVEIPLDIPTPQVPKREERKQVDAKVKDSDDIRQEKYNTLFVKFRDMLFEAGKVIKDDSSLIEYWLSFLTYCFRNKTKEDLQKPDTYTIEFLGEIESQLAVPLPQSILETVPSVASEAIKEAEKLFQ